MTSVTSATDATNGCSFDPLPGLIADLGLPRRGIDAVLRLLDAGNTVPFIARYRKEATSGLDEVQIRAIAERHSYLRELAARRETILAAIADQGKLTDDLRAQILACTTKAALEDLYLPYRPKRRTRASIARERGLEPLAEQLLAQPPGGDPLAAASAFLDAERGIPDAEAALAGARDIAAEVTAERADVRHLVRQAFSERGQLVAEVVPEKAKQRTKYEQYYAFREPVASVPSHRYLAVRRGTREGVLRTRIEVEEDPLIAEIEGLVGVLPASPFAAQLAAAIADAYRRLLAPSVEKEVSASLKERADRAAVEIFADNLRHLLLASPLGGKPVIGIDPGLRTGCKCAAVDSTGSFRGTITIYLHKGEQQQQRARSALLAFVDEHSPAAIAVGNGTGGRETEAFVRQLLAAEQRSAPFVLQVNEAGASVYSASPVAREEFPDLDVTVRGAISIGRRLQDPLAELVKIEPKAIGVGQYQHDVHQPLLSQKLGEVVEDSVNCVGVELNTASAQLLSFVAGVGPSLAKKIVHQREAHGAFRSRRALLDVPGLGPRAFEQAAGFLRIRDSEHPLDSSAVHPERYALVGRMAEDLGIPLSSLVGDAAAAARIDIARYATDDVGDPTLRDIIDELKRPGRDPRQAFEPPRFRDDVHALEDLAAGMVLEGVVTNVTAFGAFVDIGVHQDGLIHVSELADRFVKDPREVVSVGEKLSVRVLGVDLERRRISLSSRSPRDAAARRSAPANASQHDEPRRHKPRRDGPPDRSGERRPPPRRFSHNPFAKLAELKKK